jgi:hypothetical protein
MAMAFFSFDPEALLGDVQNAVDCYIGDAADEVERALLAKCGAAEAERCVVAVVPFALLKHESPWSDPGVADAAAALVATCDVSMIL